MLFIRSRHGASLATHELRLRANRRHPKMSCYELGQEYLETHKVEVSDYAFREDPILLYTDGLGPCIGLCIAWRSWAGIAHLGSHDEYDMLPKFIAEAIEFLPQNAVPDICPVICGGDPEEFAEDIRESRRVVVEAVENAGFGKLNVHWNDPGETTSLVAYLKHGIVCVESNRSNDEKYAIAAG